MARLSKGISYSSVVFGFVFLVLAVGCVAAGAVAMSKFNATLSSIGLWAIYFFIPGILLLVAGFARNIAALAVGIGANVLGTLIALGGMIYAAGVWTVLNQTCGELGGQCICFGDIYKDSGSYTFDISCSDVTTLRNLNAAITILYVVLLIMSFVGSIVGCVGACCNQQQGYDRRYQTPHAPYVIPYGNPNTMMMTRVEERRYFDHGDPYGKPSRYGNEGPYIQEKPQHYREPYLHDRPYLKSEPYIDEKTYAREVRYTNDRGYLHEPPTYHEPRALPGTQDYLFAGHTN